MSTYALDDNRLGSDRLALERELYFRLLSLSLRDDLEPALSESLALVSDVVGAHKGYLELTPPGGGCNHARPWSVGHGFSPEEVDGVRFAVSRGIIRAAIATGEAITTWSACNDERFKARDSVRDGRIEAVICAPVGDNPPLGVLYLQRREPDPFSDEDLLKVRVFARQLAAHADRLLASRGASTPRDPTTPLRERLRLDDIVGSSMALAEVLREVSLVAPLDVDVFLTGQSGTGKSQIARTIHDNSPRAGRPFVELNCAAIPETLIESELFGALPGAHSTASRKIDGKLAAANGGTLLLDEIGELSTGAQAKLLQLLQSRTYYPLGGTKPIKADLRIVAATNVDLQGFVKDGRFREDLYYRLAVLPIRLPSLAERREDIPELARHFCAAACTRHRLPRLTLSSQLVDALSTAEWPGNIRQLAHAIEAAAIRAGGSGLLQVEKAHVFPMIEASLPTKSGAPRTATDGRRLTFQEATRRFQAQLLRDTLDRTGWSVNETARLLEINRSHVYALIRGFGIERPR